MFLSFTSSSSILLELYYSLLYVVKTKIVNMNIIFHVISATLLLHGLSSFIFYIVIIFIYVSFLFVCILHYDPILDYSLSRLLAGLGSLVLGHFNSKIEKSLHKR